MDTATLSKEMLEAHPWPAQVDRDVLARCIDELPWGPPRCPAHRLRGCERGGGGCRGLPEGPSASAWDCADTCEATARVIARQTA